MPRNTLQVFGWSQVLGVDFVLFFFPSFSGPSRECSNLPGCLGPKTPALLLRSFDSKYLLPVALVAQRFSANSREVPLFVQFARHCEDLPRDLLGRSQGTIKSSSGFDPMWYLAMFWPSLYVTVSCSYSPGA